MNKEILLVCNLYNKDIIKTEKTLDKFNEFFANIIICNKLNFDLNSETYHIIDGINNYPSNIFDFIKNNKLNIKTIVFLDNLNVSSDDIIKCCEDSLKNTDTIVFGTNDSKQIKKEFINNVFNNLFNTNFKAVLPDIKAINIKLLKEIIANKQDNYLISIVNNDLVVKEKKIKTIWKKNQNGVGDSGFKILPYLKILLPYIYKAFIPYIISLILFILIFYIRNSTNDLEGILFANLIAEGVGIVLHITLNYKSVYQNNYIHKNILFLLKKIFRIILSCFFIYILYNILNFNLIISKLCIDFILMIIISIIFNKIVTKN